MKTLNLKTLEASSLVQAMVADLAKNEFNSEQFNERFAAQGNKREFFSFGNRFVARGGKA